MQVDNMRLTLVSGSETQLIGIHVGLEPDGEGNLRIGVDANGFRDETGVAALLMDVVNALMPNNPNQDNDPTHFRPMGYNAETLTDQQASVPSHKGFNPRPRGAR